MIRNKKLNAGLRLSFHGVNFHFYKTWIGINLTTSHILGACPAALTIDTITLPGLETEVAVTIIRVSRDVISHATVTLFSST